MGVQQRLKKDWIAKRDVFILKSDSDYFCKASAVTMHSILQQKDNIMLFACEFYSITSTKL